MSFNLMDGILSTTNVMEACFLTLCSLGLCIFQTSEVWDPALGAFFSEGVAEAEEEEFEGESIAKVSRVFGCFVLTFAAAEAGFLDDDPEEPEFLVLSDTSKTDDVPASIDFFLSINVMSPFVSTGLT